MRIINIFSICMVCVMFFGACAEQEKSLPPSIIPFPNEVHSGRGAFMLDATMPVIYDDANRSNADFLASLLSKGFGRTVTTQQCGEGIVLRINASLMYEIGDEGYQLSVHKGGFVIEGTRSKGVFYGIQTLRQLLPVDFETAGNLRDEISVPCLEITDFPRFKWRAFMLDESRHFKGVEVVKHLLDQMASLKMNVFHWHLTDDQGWRLEIKKYPNLTQTGGFRKDTQVSRNSDERVGEPHGGYYSQEQVKELIAYASERHIEIIPEIEMPGHASAAIASYPWLGVLGVTEVPEYFGKLDDSFNVADPRVYEFLKDVLSEVFELFPGKIVHIGGDEVNFETWKQSPKIQSFIVEQGLKSPADLQIYFTNHISQFIDEHDHRMMGWNEILGVNVHDWSENMDLKTEQELAKSAIVHFWKGDIELMMEAVSRGYDVVNSLHSET